MWPIPSARGGDGKELTAGGSKCARKGELITRWCNSVSVGSIFWKCRGAVPGGIR